MSVGIKTIRENKHKDVNLCYNSELVRFVDGAVFVFEQIFTCSR
jgi:hypothetical protein